jgi:serine/threonine-protein kinase
MGTTDFSVNATLPASQPLEMPCAFGRYELTKLLAVGGMAEVFLARSRVGGIDKPCVIKRVLPRYSTSRQFVSMFIDEARITIGLDHEHIVRLFDFGQVDGAYFMALELIDGCDLVDVLRAHKQKNEGVPPRLAAYVARCVLRGLHHAHNLTDHRGRPMGIVHRDVSPQNVFLGWNGSVKIGDFGIADAKNKLTRTLHGTVKGKFSYMSPEQASGDELDGRSDVFAVGVVLWESLVAGRLFAADNPADTIARVLEAPVLPPSEMRPGVPKELDAIVIDALRRPRAERIQSAGEMADRLDAYLAKQPCGPTELANLLAHLDLRSDETKQRGTPRTVPADGATVALPDDAALRQLHLDLRKEKNLWTLVDIAERHTELGEVREAQAAARTAASVFAHRGLLVPAICALHTTRELGSEAEFLEDLRRLADLRVHDRQALQAAVERIDKGQFFHHVQDADPSGLGRETTDVTKVPDGGSPLFSRLKPNDFARLAASSAIEERAAGAVIVTEGESGDCLFAIGRGRVVVYTKPTDDLARAKSDRVYVAALAEGDFFGEFSLLTRSPRSATVEAATDVALLRVDRSALTSIVGGEASFRDPLIEFYKERVAELVLARHPALGALAPAARRRLLATSEVKRFKDEQHIVREGEAAHAVFLVMAGEVEVYHDEDGFPVFLDKLRDGQLFGEMAALKGGGRSASVRAIGDVEVLALDAQTLAEVIKDSPEAREILHDAMAMRAEDARERIAETVRIFQGV